jgi:alpha-N-arabinofuranosidase
MIKLLPQTCSGKNNPAFLGHRQQHLKGYASTLLDFSPTSENEKAGMLIFQNEDHFYFLCRSVENNFPVVQLYRSVANSGKMELLQSQKLLSGGKLKLKIEANGNTYSFYYSDKRKWNLLKADVDAKFLSTKVAGGFVGCMYALYASSYGTVSAAKAYFNWFEYKGNDDIYKNGK